MRYCNIVVVLFVLFSFNSKAQDSSAIIKKYERQIKTGKVIRNVGLVLIPVSILTLGVAAIDGFNNSFGDASKSEVLLDVGITMFLVSIPTALTGLVIELSGRSKLKKYRLSLGATGSVPTLGFSLKF